MKTDLKLEGSMTALVTPFRDGQIDWPALEAHIDRQIAGGTQGLIPCGTTGESPTLSHEEQDAVIEFTVAQAAGRALVIAGTGSNSTAEAVRLTGHAQDAGADACLIVNPYYNKPPQRGLFEHVRRLGEVGLPIVLYNIPGRTGVELAAETVARMYDEIEAVVGIKEATGRPDVSSAIAEACEIAILSGDDSLTAPLAAVGARGVISVLANVLPGEVRALCDAIVAGDLATTIERHDKLFPLFRAMFFETNPIPVKAALAMGGWIAEELRLPLVPLAEEYRPRLAELLRPFGVPSNA